MACASRADRAAANSRSNATTCASTSDWSGGFIGSRREASGPRGGLCGALGLLREGGERGGTRDGEFGQALAIERHASVLQAADELPVRQTVLSSGRVDADDPETAKVALLATPADEGVLQ